VERENNNKEGGEEEVEKRLTKRRPPNAVNSRKKVSYLGLKGAKSHRSGKPGKRVLSIEQGRNGSSHWRSESDQQKLWGNRRDFRRGFSYLQQWREGR